MLARTAHPAAPWIVVEGESKRYARVKVVEETCRVLERGLAKWGFDVPPAT